ncbi:MAG: nucleotide exchange factor GrpE [Pseudomonadales bacterium]|nr:nucleotide exchange factor GrpE [Pseudomonadales bacterium]
MSELEQEREQDEAAAKEESGGQQAAQPTGVDAEADPAVAADAENGEVSLEALVAQLQQEVLDYRDSALRAQADAQNVKRRAEQDVEKARKFALEQFSRELLAVVDNLERTLEATAGGDDVVKPITEGVELTLKSLLDALKKFNIEPVDPQGEPFDPNLHQAMSMVENNEVEPNTVIAVMQKGYTLNGRLLRPAMVMVSKAAA